MNTSKTQWLVLASLTVWMAVFFVWLLPSEKSQETQPQFAPGSAILSPEQVQQLNDQTQELLEQLQRLSVENRKLRLMNQQLQQATKKPICV